MHQNLCTLCVIWMPHSCLSPSRIYNSQQIRGWRDDFEVKRTFCFSRIPEFNSQNPWSVTQKLLEISPPVDPPPFYLLCGHTHTYHIHTVCLWKTLRKLNKVGNFKSKSIVKQRTHRKELAMRRPNNLKMNFVNIHMPQNVSFSKLYRWRSIENNLFIYKV